MELWDNVGSNTEEPQQWNSNKTGGGNAGSTFAPQTCFRDGSPHGGIYCAKIVTGTAAIVGTVVNGSLTTGNVEAPTTSKPDGYIRTIATDPAKRMAFTGRPDSIVFWYKYTAASTAEYPRLEARLHVGFAYSPEAPVNSNHPDSTVNIIARAPWVGATGVSVGTWTRVALPFVYVAGTPGQRTPQYILITSTSSGDQNAGVKNSTFWLDDFSVIYNPKINVGTVTAPGPYYVSASQGAAISVPFTLSGTFNAANTVTAQLSDSSGSFASPVNIGSLTNQTSSGTISATIQAGTLSGNKYRVRVISSNPALTSADNGANIQVILVANSIAPTAVQNLQISTSGTQLTVTETAGFTSREWRYATVSGGATSAFAPAQTTTTYTPNFATAGTYYVVCITTYPGGITVKSNEVQVNVAGVNIAPAATQTIPINTNGATLTATETPAATSREWKYSTISGGPYSSFAPAQTGTIYTPNFATSGTYYVVCVSTYGSTPITSNQVQVNVVSNSIAPTAIQTIAANANGNSLTVTETPAATSREWKYATVSGGPYASFAPAKTATTYTPNFATAGTYYVVCVSTFGSTPITSNQVQINVVANSIAPTTAQSILAGVNGNVLTVTETPTGTSREWKYGTISGGPYSSFAPTPQTGNNYTPNFAALGNYYVVCKSVISGVTATSNEVLISVGGATITTGTITGSPFKFSPNAPNANVSVPYTTSGTFTAGNVFTAQLSNASGSFAAPTNIGTLTSVSSGTIAAVIPKTTPAGTAYRIRVISSTPVVNGSDNGTNLVVDQFNISIAPTASQNIALSTNGTQLSVTESQVATGGRKWKTSTVTGGPYTDIVGQTNFAYTPNFNTPGPHYVVCVSINQYNDPATSNEVLINVSNGTNLATSAVSGSPFNVSPNANVTTPVSYTSNAVFGAGNIFTAQLSDASGSFASPVSIGTFTGTTLTPITATIPNSTPSGVGYRIRVVSTNPALTGTDNGTNLIVNQFANSIAPTATQNLALNAVGTALTVTATQTATHAWKYSTVSGSGYGAFVPAQTGVSYIPQFATPGTYYVVAVSKNGVNDTVTSNEVMIVVQNGTNLTTLAVNGSPFLVSPKAKDTVIVNYSSNAVFNAGNVFTTELSNQSGSFTNPIVIGTLAATSPAAITALIPNNSINGIAYRIRVTSSNPALVGTDNGADLTITQFAAALSPLDTQNIYTNQNGTLITSNETHPVIDREWFYSFNGGFQYFNFTPNQKGATYLPNFPDAANYMVKCVSINKWNDTVESATAVVINVTDNPNVGIKEANAAFIKAYTSANYFVVDLTNAKLSQAALQILNMNGQVVATQKLNANAVNTVNADFAAGVYVFRITDAESTFVGKFVKQ
jgi:hypothetical protein